MKMAQPLLVVLHEINEKTVRVVGLIHFDVFKGLRGDVHLENRTDLRTREGSIRLHASLESLRREQFRFHRENWIEFGTYSAHSGDKWLPQLHWLDLEIVTDILVIDEVAL